MDQYASVRGGDQATIEVAPNSCSKTVDHYALPFAPGDRPVSLGQDQRHLSMPSGRSDCAHRPRRHADAVSVCASSLRPWPGSRLFPTHRPALRHQDQLHQKLTRRSQADVRCRMILKPPFDHFGIGRGVMQSMAPFFVEISGYIEPGTKGKSGSLCDAYASAAARWSNRSVCSATGDRSTLVSRTKISSLDPSLTSVRPAHPAEPLPAFSDPPIKRSCR